MKYITPTWAKILFIPALIMFAAPTIVLPIYGIQFLINGNLAGIAFIFLTVFFGYQLFHGIRLYKHKDTKVGIESNILTISNNDSTSVEEYNLRDLTVNYNWFARVYYVYPKSNRNNFLFLIDDKYIYGMTVIKQIINK
jgi:hypothetical protein